MDFSLTLLTYSDAWPVSVVDAREQLNIIGSDDDAMITRAIGAATRKFERHTRRALLEQSYRLEIENNNGPIEIPRPPLVSIDSIKSKQQLTDSWTTVAADDYTLQSSREPAQITWDSGTTPPYVQIDFTCGYATSDDVPEDYRMSILQLVAFMYENRGDVEAKIPLALRGMLDSQRVGCVTGYWSG